MTSISVLGLGAMGSALASALLAAGHRVTVWNRSPRTTPAGALVAASAAEALRASPLAIVCVLDYAAARAVLPPEALADRVIVNLTNGTPAEARALAATVTQHGARYLDGAVMVTPDMVGGPHASVLYSGDPQAYAEHAASLAALGAGTHVGDDIAQAALYDLALLASMFGMFGGFLHAAALLRSDGVAVSAVAPMITALLHAMVELIPETARQIDTGDAPAPASNNRMMAAGLRNILDGSREQRVRGDLIAPIAALFSEGVTAGLGDHDIAALAPLLRARE